MLPWQQRYLGPWALAAVAAAVVLVAAAAVLRVPEQQAVSQTRGCHNGVVLTD